MPAESAPLDPAVAPEPEPPRSPYARYWPGDEYAHRLYGEVPIHFTAEGGSYAAPTIQYRGRAESVSIEVELPFVYSDAAELGGSAVFLFANPTATVRSGIFDGETLRVDAGFGLAIPVVSPDEVGTFSWRKDVAALGGAADMQGLWNVWRYRPDSVSGYGVFGLSHLDNSFEVRSETRAGVILANSRPQSVPTLAFAESVAVGYRTERIGVGVALRYVQLLALDTPPTLDRRSAVLIRPLKDSERSPSAFSAMPYLEFTRATSFVRLDFSFGLADNVVDALGEVHDTDVGDPIRRPWAIGVSAGSRF